MKTSDSITKISAALVKAQMEMGAAKKSANNPFFKSKYADLSAISEACRPALLENGIAVIQSPTLGPEGESGIGISTRLVHESGEWIESGFVMPVAKSNDPQAVGSAITYGRRYQLAGMCGVNQEDDDGNAAATPAPKKKPVAKKTVDMKKTIAAFKTIGVPDWAVREFKAEGDDRRAELLAIHKMITKKTHSIQDFFPDVPVEGAKETASQLNGSL